MKTFKHKLVIMTLMQILFSLAEVIGTFDYLANYKVMFLPNFSKFIINPYYLPSLLSDNFENLRSRGLVSNAGILKNE